MSKRQVILKISNCLDCPHHAIVPSIIFDSYDVADRDVVCTKINGRHKARYGTIKGRAVVLMERYNIRKQAAVPAWCPLEKVK